MQRRFKSNAPNSTLPREYIDWLDRLWHDITHSINVITFILKRLLNIKRMQQARFLTAMEGWAGRYIISSHSLEEVYTVDIAILTILYVH